MKKYLILCCIYLLFLVTACCEDGEVVEQQSPTVPGTEISTNLPVDEDTESPSNGGLNSEENI